MVKFLFPARKRLIGIGDLHGDLKLAKTLLMLANVADKHDQWIGGDTFVVQVGDLVDSCRSKPCDEQNNTNSETSDDIGVVEYLLRMNELAKRDGGRVIFGIGNHELMNSAGNFSYVSHNNLANFSYGKLFGVAGRQKAFEPGGKMAKIFSKMPAVIIVGKNLFVHGGILPSHLQKLPGDTPREKISKFNKLVSDYFAGKASYAYEELNDENSPFWTRLYGQKLTDPQVTQQVCGTLEKVLNELGVETMIIGHTPQKGKVGINGVCDNRLWRIDGGFSTGFFCMNNGTSYNKQRNYSRIQFLEIIDDTEYRIIQGTRE